MNVPPSRQIAQGVPPSNRKAKTRSWLVGGGALLLILAAFGYFTRTDNTPAGAQPRPVAAAPVRVAEVTRRDMPVIRRTPGTAIANTTVQITARVQGVLEAANALSAQAGTLQDAVDGFVRRVAAA